ncbi:DUF418 domain-containing protein [Streptomyces anandii]|uniref:DUF418 domain-containing protein n=1 Tax=Streptomyces anandii TaxID=285454 RepID=A0ABW6H934_9ACTN
MTSTAPETEVRDRAPSLVDARVPAPGGRRPLPGRLVGIDLARGIAVFGMYAVHVGPDATVGGPVGFALETASGRSSALFAFLAGFSLTIITGRPHPRTGRAGRQAVARVAIRALVLLVLGYALTALDTEVNVILSCYGLLFLTALPLHRLRAPALALVAAGGALVLPQILYVVRASLGGGGTSGMAELLFTGNYPALTWFPFLVAGMAVARLDLTRRGTKLRLMLTGGALAVLGYGGSWLALHLVPRALPAVASATGAGSASSAWWSDTVGEPHGRVPPAWLLVAAPHSETTFSVVGNTGVALCTVVVCLAVADRMPRLTRLARPVAAVGSTALSVYVLQILALWFFGDVWYVPAVGGDGLSALTVLFSFIATAMVLATLWTRWFRRGPLEHLLHAATRPAEHVG